MSSGQWTSKTWFRDNSRPKGQLSGKKAEKWEWASRGLGLKRPRIWPTGWESGSTVISKSSDLDHKTSRVIHSNHVLYTHVTCYTLTSGCGELMTSRLNSWISSSPGSSISWSSSFLSTTPFSVTWGWGWELQYWGEIWCVAWGWRGSEGAGSSGKWYRRGDRKMNENQNIVSTL